MHRRTSTNALVALAAAILILATASCGGSSDPYVDASTESTIEESPSGEASNDTSDTNEPDAAPEAPEQEDSSDASAPKGFASIGDQSLELTLAQCAIWAEDDINVYGFGVDDPTIELAFDLLEGVASMWMDTDDGSWESSNDQLEMTLDGDNITVTGTASNRTTGTDDPLKLEFGCG